jgi:outer membrane protein assembly factor BamB
MTRSTFNLATALVAALVACGADWPQFRGPNRDGRSAEKGLLERWPKGGPKRIWKSTEVGFGWAGVSVTGGRVYTTGLFGKDIHVVALDAKGGRLWQKRLDRATAAMGYRGARTTPTVDGDRLYVLSDGGIAACLNRSDGKILWSKNVLKEYRAPNARHSLAESPLVDGDRVYFTVGGKASIVALDNKTGRQIWAARPVDPRVGYVSARLVDHGGLRQVVSLTGKSIFGVRADDGRVLWTHPRPTPHEININAPHVLGSVLFVSSGYKVGTEALRLTVRGREASVKRLWNAPRLDDFMGGLVLVGKALVGTCHEQAKGLTAIDVRTGKQVYKNPAVGEAALIWADGRIYCQEYEGKVALVNPPDGKVISRFSIPVNTKKTKMWAHPAISDGRLYIRHESALSVYDIKAK